MIGRVEGSGPTPSEADLRRIEDELGVKFNKEYAVFILHNNGGRPEKNIYDIPPDNHSDIHGIIPLGELPLTHRIFEDRTGRDIVPIMFDASGNYICMDMSNSGTGDIYFLDHEISGRDALTLLAPSLKAFLEGVRPNDVKVVLRPGQVTSVWVNPEFLKKFPRKK